MIIVILFIVSYIVQLFIFTFVDYCTLKRYTDEFSLRSLLFGDRKMPLFKSYNPGKYDKDIVYMRPSDNPETAWSALMPVFHKITKYVYIVYDNDSKEFPLITIHGFYKLIPILPVITTVIDLFMVIMYYFCKYFGLLLLFLFDAIYYLITCISEYIDKIKSSKKKHSKKLIDNILENIDSIKFKGNKKYEKS